MCQEALGDAYVLFLLEDKEGLPVAVVLPAETVAAQELVLPQVRGGTSIIRARFAAQTSEACWTRRCLFVKGSPAMAF